MQQAVKHGTSPTDNAHQLGRAPWRCALQALPPLASQGGLPVALPQHWCSPPPPLPAQTELQPHACTPCAENEVKPGAIVALTEHFQPLSLTLGPGSQKVLLKVRWECEPSGDSAFSIMRIASSISLSAAKASGLRKGILCFLSHTCLHEAICFQFLRSDRMPCLEMTRHGSSAPWKDISMHNCREAAQIMSAHAL